MNQSSRLSSFLVSGFFALSLIAALLLSCSLEAAEEKKIEFPAASQHSVIKQRVGLTDIEVDYSRPNKNGREIFGGLVPYGKLWRTGANMGALVQICEWHVMQVCVGGNPARGLCATVVWQ